jgi:hypothetical protein
MRMHLRELQWQLPLRLQSVLLRIVGGRYDPYADWHRCHRAIFVHVPRTAGTSTAMALGAPKPHVPISRYAAFDRAAFAQYYKFAFVRNPWDRLLSAFSDLCAAANRPAWPEGMFWSRAHLSRFANFETFVLALSYPKSRRTIFAHHHFRPQLDWLTLPHSNKGAMDFLGRFESLDEDFATVIHKLGIDETLPVANNSHHSPYREAYSRKMQGIVGDLYEADIRAFGYRF